MKFCSECGAKVAATFDSSDQKERLVCSGCGTVHYENPKILVVCAASWEGRLLFCRRAHEPGRGLWMLPGGFMENGETLQQAAVRGNL